MIVNVKRKVSLLVCGRWARSEALHRMAYRAKRHERDLEIFKKMIIFSLEVKKIRKGGMAYGTGINTLETL